MRIVFGILCSLSMISCVGLPNQDPLTINVAGIEPLPSEGLEMRLDVSIRITNPNDAAVEYSGAALDLYLNGRRLASGVSDITGTLPRYGEVILSVPVTISAFDVARQLIGFMTRENTNEFDYRVRGKLEGGFFGTRRFEDEGTINLNLPEGPA